MKKTLPLIIIIILVIIGVGYLFLNSKNNSSDEEQNVNIAEEDPCVELSKFSKQNAEQIILEECRKYYDKSCTSNNECGSFPCENNVCLIKPCNSDAECPTLCGLHATPVPGFCTTIDVI